MPLSPKKTRKASKAKDLETRALRKALTRLTALEVEFDDYKDSTKVMLGDMLTKVRILQEEIGYLLNRDDEL